MVTEVDKGVNVSPVPEVVTVHLAMNIHIIITRVSAAFGRQNPRLDGREITSPEDCQSGR